MATVHSELSGRARRAARVQELWEREDALPRQSPALRIDNTIADWMICALFVSGILVLMFHAWEGGNIARVAQILGVLLLLAAGGLAWLFGCRFAPPAPVELCLLAMGFLSLFRLTLNSDISVQTVLTSFSVSVILLLAVTANGALVRRLSMESVLNVSAAALALATIPVLMHDYQGIVGGLTAGADKWKWLFRPLHLHHSLASIIFSLGIVLSVYRIVVGQWLVKAVFSVVLITQAAIVLSTGGRTGIVACATSLMLVFLMRMRRAPPIVWFGVLIATVVSLWFFDLVLGYLSSVLELESQYRGWGSGATGRTEIWARGVELILADPVRLLFGSGLRTAGVQEIGFNPENSYIAIVLESGGILLLWFLIAMLATVVRLHYHATDPDKDTRLILYGLLPIVQFALIVGIFNRQLLAVGNPASMIFLVVFSGAWIYVSGPKPVRETAGPQVAIERVPEPGSERRRKKAQEQSGLPRRDAVPSSRALLRRHRAKGALAEFS